MPTSVFFNNFQSSQEQLLIENLVIESIKIYGHDVYYCPRTLKAKDEIYNEDAVSVYNTSFYVEMYVKNIMGFQGDGDFMSKFNLQIRDQMILTIAKRTFYDEIGNVEGLDRPQEGDLIYFPLNKKIFVVKFVEHEPVFYQMGALQMYDLTCELWEYSNEKMNTGIADIDKLQKDYSFDMSTYSFQTENEFVIVTEDGFDLIQEAFNYVQQTGDVFEDNSELQDATNEIIDFSEIDPFSEGHY